jgi:hypothetical protein
MRKRRDGIAPWKSGLDVIALVGTLRYQQQHSILQIQSCLREVLWWPNEPSITDQFYRYEELLALRLADKK